MSWHDTSGVAPDAAASRLDREWRASVDALVAEADAAFDARRLARQRAAVARRVAQRALGVPLAQAVAACAQLAPVPGRMERLVAPGQPLVAVDYAHTPDALDKALQALRPLAVARGGRLWCVFGCGGDRDASKRPLMGAVAQHQADAVVVTSDNPRSEEPGHILHQILLGTIAGETVRAEPDRAAAIAQVLAEADARDVVLIAGKGHEEYQETAGVRQPFSDMAQARAALERRGVCAWQ